uniref:Secreted protein n=1 Tax=Parascaris univalens TaxID=6257 RepID=A0A915BQ47_PARUN
SWCVAMRQIHLLFLGTILLVSGQKCLRCPSGWSYFPDTDHCYIRLEFVNFVEFD